MTFDEVDEQLTLPRYNALQRFWMKHPPTQILLAGYVGYNAPTQGDNASKDAPVSEEMDDESMSALAEVFGLPVRKPKGK